MEKVQRSRLTNGRDSSPGAEVAEVTLFKRLSSTEEHYSLFVDFRLCHLGNSSIVDILSDFQQISTKR